MGLMCSSSPGIIPYHYGLWHMPLFMAVAGYFFCRSAGKRTVKELLATKVIAILIPCILWGIIGNIAAALVTTHHISTNIGLLDVARSLWFLKSICICFCLCVIPDRIFRYSPCLANAIAVLLCVGLYMLPEVWPICNYNIAYMFPFFYAGYITSRYNLIKRVRSWLVVSCLALAIAMWIAVTMGYFKGWSVWTSGTYLWGPLGFERHLYLNAVRLVMGFSGSVGFAGVMWHLFQWCKSRQLTGYPIVRYIRCFFIQMGVFSLSVYAVQSIVVETVFKHFMGFLYIKGHLAAIVPCNPLLYKYVYLLAAAIVMSLVCLLIIAVLAKVPLCRKYLLGK